MKSAQTMCTHLPSLVCFIAPGPSLSFQEQGQRQHFTGELGDFKHFLHNHWPENDINSIVLLMLMIMMTNIFKMSKLLTKLLKKWKMNKINKYPRKFKTIAQLQTDYRVSMCCSMIMRSIISQIDQAPLKLRNTRPSRNSFVNKKYLSRLNWL